MLKGFRVSKEELTSLFNMQADTIINNSFTSSSTPHEAAQNLSLNASSGGETIGPSNSEIISQVIILLVVLIISVGGNGLVCFLVFTVKQLQIPTNYFILS